MSKRPTGTVQSFCYNIPQPDYKALARKLPKEDKLHYFTFIEEKSNYFICAALNGFVTLNSEGKEVSFADTKAALYHKYPLLLTHYPSTPTYPNMHQSRSRTSSATRSHRQCKECHVITNITYLLDGYCEDCFDKLVKEKKIPLVSLIGEDANDDVHTVKVDCADCGRDFYSSRWARAVLCPSCYTELKPWLDEYPLIEPESVWRDGDVSSVCHQCNQLYRKYEWYRILCPECEDVANSTFPKPGTFECTHNAEGYTYYCYNCKKYVDPDEYEFGTGVCKRCRAFEIEEA